MLLLALSLPVLSLIPLGSLWLWQNGLFLHWGIAALSITTLLYSLEAWVLPSGMSTSRPPEVELPGASGTAREKAARAELGVLVSRIQPAEIQSRADIAALAIRTVETVARVLHPKDKTPVWNFTIPEVLLLAERVTARMRPMFIELVPLGDTMTVGQALRLYEWRTMIGTAEKAYDIWRLLRVVNPLAAITQEARSHIGKQLVSNLRDDFTKRLVRVFVSELGDAAIELYGGRLRAPAVDAPTDGTSTKINTTAQTGHDDHRPDAPAQSHAWVGQRIWSEARKLGRAAAGLYAGKRDPGKRDPGKRDAGKRGR